MTEKNRTLWYASIILKLFTVLFILSFALFVFAAVYWHIKPGAFNKVDISSGFKAGFGFEIKTIEDNKPGQHIILSEISQPMLYWLVLRNTIFFVLGLMILKKIRNIISSIKTQNTFYDGNIIHFKTLGRLFFIVAAWSCFNFYDDGGSIIIELDIPFTPLLLAMACLVIAEIFKEGKLLAEDKKLIV